MDFVTVSTGLILPYWMGLPIRYIHIIKSNQLSDAFCIAVRGHKGWGDLFKAKYSLAVSFEAIHQDIPIYEPIRTEIESVVENGEIEIEMAKNNQ